MRRPRNMVGKMIFGNKFEMTGHIGVESGSVRRQEDAAPVAPCCMGAVGVVCTPLGGRRASGGDRM